MLLELINGIQWDTDKQLSEQSPEAQALAMDAMAGTPIEADDETCRNNFKRPTFRAYNFYGGYLQISYTYSKGPMTREWAGLLDQTIIVSHE